VSGHVFHPGHDELHGVTVVLDTRTGRTCVGRYHDVERGEIRLHDAAIHEAAAGDRDGFLRRVIRFGIPPEHRVLRVPEAEVTGITPLNRIEL
jgi:hypothetical protein